MMNTITKIKNFIPNFITLLNLLCGILSIFFVVNGNPIVASFLIVGASVFDFLDGFVARALKAYSELGKQLDSLSDLVSFGVAPAFILQYFIATKMDMLSQSGETYSMWLAYIIYFGAFIIPLFSAYRLAVFNLDTKQTTEFLGLPTPATGLFIASLTFFYTEHGIIISPSNMLIIGLAFGFLMVSRIPMLSLKFKNLNIKENIYRFILILTGIVLIIVTPYDSITLIMICYIMLSFIRYIIGLFSKDEITTSEDVQA